MDFEYIKDFAHKYFLPKEIANCKMPLYSFCIEAKQSRTLILASAIGDSIKLNNLRLDSKISHDHYHSCKPRVIANNNRQILIKEYALYRNIIVNYASDFIFHFIKTSVESYQTAKAKYKFETFAESCSIEIKHYHADNYIFNNNLSKESCISACQSWLLYRVNVYH